MSDVTKLDPELLTRLYRVAPEEFVATRNAEAKALRGRGEREEAAAVAALRRPSVADWALNLVAAEHPDTVGSFAEAAEQLRRAQGAAVAGHRRDDLRDAVHALRTQTAEVVRRADELVVQSGRAPGSQTSAITTRLGEVAGDEAAAEQFRAGHLGSAPIEPTDPFAGVAPADVTPASPRATAGRADRAGRAATTGRAASKAAAAGNAAAAAPSSPTPRQAAVRAQVRLLERGVSAAEREHAIAHAKLARADEDRQRAANAVAQASARLDSARARLEAMEAERDRVAEAAERADAALRQAQDALDAARS